MADLRIVDAPLLSTVKGTEKLPTGGEGNFSVSVNQVVDFAKLKWFLATEGYVDNAVGNVQADLNLHKNNESNPHNVTKTQVGLGNVDNTADLDKPLSNADIAALSLKAEKVYVDAQDNLKADKTELIASKITSDGNQNQQVINDFGGAKWYAKSGGYELGATLKLENGNIVKSTVANNIINPNVDMTGWVKTNDASQIFDASGNNLQQSIDNYNNQFCLVEKYKQDNSEYIDDALDRIKADFAAKGSMSGVSILIPQGISRIKRSHDLSITGLRIVGDGGRYASRIVADANGDYSNGYVLKIAPTSGQSITGGSGLETITIDLNEAPAIGLIYQGAYDVSALDRAEVINGHKDFPCAIIEPHPDGTVIQTLKIDTSGFSKKSVGGTGYTVVARLAQECIILNSKMFGSPSNQTTKGSVPLLLEDVRGIQIIGGGFANSETNCIHIHAKTRSCTHVTIIGPTFEGFKAKAIKTWGDFSVAEPTVTNKVSRLIVINERLIAPAAGLLDASDLTFSTIYASNSDIELKTGCTNNTVHTYDKSKVIDNGQYNEVIESPSTLNSNKHVSTRQQSIKMASTPAYNLEVDGRTGGYRFQWTASAATDTGAAIYTPNGSMPIRFLDDRLGFFGSSPIVQRTSPLSSATDTAKISAIILALEQLGLFKAAI